MTTLSAKQIAETKVPTHALKVWALGQSGYLIKNSQGGLLAIDPYLTETILRGYPPYIHKRQVEPVIAPDTIPDLNCVLLTHVHQDHLDPNSVVALARKNSPQFYGSPEVYQRLRDLDIPENTVNSSSNREKLSESGFTIFPTKAVHNCDARGFILQAEDIVFYFSGDTCLFLGMAEIGSRFDVDAAFLCINGQGQNMDYYAALQATEMIDAESVVPTHYGMYPDNTAVPEKFEQLFRDRFRDKRTCKPIPAGQSSNYLKRKGFTD